MRVRHGALVAARPARVARSRRPGTAPAPPLAWGHGAQAQDVPPRSVTRRRHRLVSVCVLPTAALVALLLASCGLSNGSSYDPDMEGAPEARAAASAAVDAAAEHVVFSDRVTVLGQGRADGCGVETEEGFFADVIGMHCSMGWMVALVVPGADTREEVAGAIDDELRAMDVTYAWPLATDLVMHYPSVRDGTVLRGGGRVGEVELVVESTPFRPATWRAPRIPRGSAEVSADGDLESVTSSVVQETGADEVVTVLLSTMYWDTSGRNSSSSDPVAPGPLLAYYSEGPVYAFDVALPEPADGGLTCTEDAAVDPGTVSSMRTPFPRLTFSLGPSATSDDMQRVRECLVAGLDAGAIAVLTPRDP